MDTNINFFNFLKYETAAKNDKKRKSNTDTFLLRKETATTKTVEASPNKNLQL